MALQRGQLQPELWHLRLRFREGIFFVLRLLRGLGGGREGGDFLFVVERVCSILARLRDAGCTIKTRKKPGVGVFLPFIPPAVCVHLHPSWVSLVINQQSFAVFQWTNCKYIHENLRPFLSIPSNDFILFHSPLPNERSQTFNQL